VGREVDVAVDVALGGGRGEFVAPDVAVTTMITGEGQSHWFSRSGVSVEVAVIEAVREAVGVMLGV